MIKTFYCFRHGQTDWNKEHKIQGGAADLPLNEIGIEQASDIPDMPIEEIYTSPMIRAQQTAALYNEKKGLEVIVESGFKEVNFGDWGGKTWKDVVANYGQESVDKFFSIDPKDDDFKAPNGSVKGEIINNFTESLKDIGRNSNCEKIGVFTHGRMLYFISNRLSCSDIIIPVLKNSEYIQITYNTETAELKLVEDKA